MRREVSVISECSVKLSQTKADYFLECIIILYTRLLCTAKRFLFIVVKNQARGSVG